MGGAKQSLEQGTLIVHRVLAPAHLKIKSDFNVVSCSDQEDWKILKSLYNAKKQRVVDNLGQAWKDLWKQCTQALKNWVRTDSMFEKAEVKIDSITLAIMIREVCNSTTTITSYTMWTLKADLSLKSISWSIYCLC